MREVGKRKAEVDFFLWQERILGHLYVKMPAQACAQRRLLLNSKCGEAEGCSLSAWREGCSRQTSRSFSSHISGTSPGIENRPLGCSGEVLAQTRPGEEWIWHAYNRDSRKCVDEKHLFYAELLEEEGENQEWVGVFCGSLLAMEVESGLNFERKRHGSVIWMGDMPSLCTLRREHRLQVFKGDGKEICI